LFSHVTISGTKVTKNGRVEFPNDHTIPYKIG
jgi:hypothetical protein